MPKRKIDDDKDAAETATPAKKKSRKEKIAEAKRRAAEWGKQEREERSKKKLGGTGDVMKTPAVPSKSATKAKARATPTATKAPSAPVPSAKKEASTATFSSPEISAAAAASKSPLTVQKQDSHSVLTVNSSLPLTGSSPIVTVQQRATPAAPETSFQNVPPQAAAGAPVPPNFHTLQMMYEGYPHHLAAWATQMQMANLSQPSGAFPQQTPSHLFQQSCMPSNAAFAPQVSSPAVSEVVPKTPAPTPAAAVLKKKSSSTQQARIEALVASVPPETSHDGSDDEHTMPPPPTTLEMQISQQVKQNLQASMENQIIPHTHPPQEAYDNIPSSQDHDGNNEDHLLEDDDQPIDMNPVVSSRNSKTSYLKWIIIVFLVAAGISVCLTDVNTDLPPEAGTETIFPGSKVNQKEGRSKDAVCFMDTVARYKNASSDGELREELIEPCEDFKGDMVVESCPPRGVCFNGKLTRCLEPDFEVSKDRLGCVVTFAVKAKLDQWVNVVTDLTAVAVCRNYKQGNPPLSKYPTFETRDLIDRFQLPDVTPKVLQTIFEVQTGQGWVDIHFPADVSIPVSFPCRLSHFFASFLSNLFYWAKLFSWRLLRSIAVALFRSFQGSPILSTICWTVMFAAFKYKTYQSRRKQLVMDVATMRDASFDYLMDYPEQSHASLAIRDELVAKFTRHQDVLQGARKQRHYWNSQVWPRVVPQLNQDARVRKTLRLDATTKKMRDYYQWIAAARTPRQVHIMKNESKKEQ